METCGWLVQVPTSLLYPAEAEWYPDSPEDVYTEVECGQPVKPGGRHALCEFHQYAMDLPDVEFETISEAHDGRAFS